MMLRLFILLMCCMLSACSSVSSSPDANTIASNKKDSTAKINVQLGMMYLKKRDVQLAKQKFLLAIDEDPTLPEAWYGMGYFLEVTGDRDEADKHYLKTISLAPNRGDVQNNYGTFLCHAGNYQEAIKHFMLATKDPEYLDTASAYENAGLCALKIPNKSLALDYFNRAIMQDPKHSLSLMESAELNYEQKNYHDAKSRLAEFLAISSPTAQSEKLSRELART